MTQTQHDQLVDAAQKADDKCELTDRRYKKRIKKGIPPADADKLAGVAERSERPSVRMTALKVRRRVAPAGLDTDAGSSGSTVRACATCG